MAPPQTIPTAPLRRKKPSKKGGGLGRIIGALILIVFSPVLLLLDALRSGPSHKNTLYAFMMVTTVVMAVTGMAILVTEAPTNHLFKTLSNLGDGSEIEVPHDQELNTVYQCALKYRVDPQLIIAVIKTESDFQSDQVSARGAKGLMQIMPQTWRHYNPKSVCDGLHSLPIPDHKVDCIFNPEANIETGVHYLRDLLDYYHGRADLAVEAYNAGLSNVVPSKRPKYQETQHYVRRIAQIWAEFRKDPVALHIQMIIGLRRSLAYLLMTCGSLWLILFFWVTRRVLPVK